MCRITASLALPKSISCSAHLPNTLSASTGDSAACQTLWMPCWVKLMHWTLPEFNYTQLEKNSDRWKKRKETQHVKNSVWSIHSAHRHQTCCGIRERRLWLRWGTGGIAGLCHNWGCGPRDRGDLCKLLAIVTFPLVWFVPNYIIILLPLQLLALFQASQTLFSCFFPATLFTLNGSTVSLSLQVEQWSVKLKGLWGKKECPF